MDHLLKSLGAIVGADNLKVGAGVEAYAVDGRPPRVAAFPGTVDQLSAVLAVCHGARAAVTPWGGGTSMGLGAPPNRLDVVLGMQRLTGILEYEPADMTSTVQAGITLADYQAALGKDRQFLALDPPQPDRATVGGIIAANASGPRRLRYGTARDQVLGLKVVQADGTVIKVGAKVVKNVTGYDLNKLFVGSLGTLGVIVEATLRLYPLAAAEGTWVGAFPTIAPAADTVARILDSPIVPSAVELLSKVAAARVAPLAGIDPGKRALLAVAVASVPEAVKSQLDAVAQLAREAGGEGRTVEGASHDALWRAVSDVTAGTDGLVLKAALPPDRVARAFQAGESLAERSGFDVAMVAEAGTGVVRYCIDPKVVPSGALLEAVQWLRAFALKARGTLVVLHAPPALKPGLDVWGPVANGLALMRGVKAAYDPHAILNPGRFVGGI
ncbi:MAG TPA: FAD-binding oxidoreductase [Candidatus Sulfotelmatobacter sp.]|nr:FAD-binding oxidoreductase [Candidatus Sulfotelmatobacter sp.]